MKAMAASHRPRRKSQENSPEFGLQEFLARFQTWQGLFTGLVVLFILIGNWSPLRLSGQVEAAAWYAQPRAWIVIALVVLSLRRTRRPKSRAKADPALARALWKSTRYVMFVAAFLLYMMASALWAPDIALALEKLVGLLLLALTCVLFGMAIARSRGTGIHDVFWGAILVLSGALGGISMLGFGVGDSARAAALGGGPNAFGASMALGAMGALYFAPRFSSRLLRNAVIGLYLFFVVLVISSGSRGALLSLLLGTATFLILKRESVRILPGLALTGLLALLVFSESKAWEYAQASFERRIVGLVVERQYMSERDLLFYLALDVAQDHWLLGGGLESFQIETGWIYPHNLFMEALTEGGLAGLFLLLLSLGFLTASAFRNRRYLEPAALGAAVAMLAFSQFSGNLFDSRRYFLVSILVLVPIMHPPARLDGRNAAGESHA